MVVVVVVVVVETKETRTQSIQVCVCVREREVRRSCIGSKRCRKQKTQPTSAIAARFIANGVLVIAGAMDVVTIMMIIVTNTNLR